MNKIRRYWEEDPLVLILVVAAILRLLASFVSFGYPFHDDHFLTVTPAQHWVYGLNYWLEEEFPPSRTLLYPGIFAGFFWLMDNLGVTDPVIKIKFMQLLHGAWSLLTVVYTFKIASLLSNRETAARAGMIMAVLWFWPSMSVKFLVEMIVIPLILMAFYQIIRAVKTRRRLINAFMIAGILLGLAFTIRYQVILFAGGMGLVLLIRKQWKEAITFTVAWVVFVALFIGIHDLILYDEPFASVVSYVSYNVENVYEYPNGPPTRSLWVILGYLVPPISLLLVFGFARSWRIEPMLFAGALAFFVFHALWPNKQERFLFTVMPMIVILGTVGWYQYANTRKLPDWLTEAVRGSWVFFWVMNTFVALFLVFTNNKKDRVEPVVWLSDKNVQAVAVVQPDPQDPMIPVFYLGKPAIEYRRLFYPEVGAGKMLSDRSYRTNDLAFFYALRPGWTREKLDQMVADTTKEPEYVIVRGTAEEIERGFREISVVYPSLSLEKVVEPSTYDRILFFLNPDHNPIKRVNIYKIN